MRVLTLLFAGLVSVGSSSAFAASYQQIDGTIVDPIQSNGGGDHFYSGVDLVPGVSASGADLNNADLINADLSNATLVGGPFHGQKPCEAGVVRTRRASCYLAHWDLDSGALAPGMSPADSYGYFDHILKYIRFIRLAPDDVEAVAAHVRQ